MADTQTSPKQHFIETALDALSTSDRILGGSGHPATKASPSEMHAYAIDPAYQASPVLLHSLKTDPRTRADFQKLLSNTARYYLPQVAAASSGQIEQREADGCKISFRPSRANEAHIYVIIESIGDITFNPTLLFVCDASDHLERAELPEAQNGRIQLLLERESPMAQGLLDIKTEVYLK